MYNQTEEYKKAFATIKKNVSTEDRKAAVDAGLASKPTIQNYLGGDIRDVDTASRLLEFFKGRIDARSEKLRQVLNK